MSNMTVKFNFSINACLRMAPRPHRALLMLVLLGYFTSKIITAYSKLREGKVGTAYDNINAETIEVGYRPDYFRWV